MLDDRPYMREPEFRQRPVTITLLIVIVVCFVIQCFFQAYLPNFQFSHKFGLSYETLMQGWVWQLVTFQFLHAPLPGGLLHILLNCLGLYTFGVAVEDSVGRADFLKLYLGSGIVGGFMHVLGVAAWPGHFGSPWIPVVGASAGLFGVIGAYGALFPERQLTLLVFYFIPVTLTARTLLIISAALAVFGIIFPDSAPGVAHGAHLGGLIAGLLFVKVAVLGQWSLPFRLPNFKQSAKSPPPRLARAKVDARKPQAAEDVLLDSPPADFISKEVDPILDKISAHGIQSLSEREKKILEAARAKMARK